MDTVTSLIRLDKYLSDLGIGTRSEVKKDIRKRKVKVNEEIVINPAYKLNIHTDKVYFNDQLLEYIEYIYLMLNKPAGYVSATKDNIDKTVIDLIDKPYNKDLFPVGRLDKDTEGLVLITNDGHLAHNILSPNKKVPKVYYAEVDGKVTGDHVLEFKKGLRVSKDFTALASDLNILESGETSKVNLTIYEGKFHQVKRMFEAVGMKVTYLKRISMGNLTLDESLKLGEYRELTGNELKTIKF